MHESNRAAIEMKTLLYSCGSRSGAPDAPSAEPAPLATKIFGTAPIRRIDNNQSSRRR
jgi:hypothetical protein